MQVQVYPEELDLEEKRDREYLKNLDVLYGGASKNRSRV